MKKIAFYLTILFSVSLAILGGYLCFLQSNKEQSGTVICLYIVALAIGWYLSLQMHEYGHKLFGIFVGMEVKVSPYKIFSSSLGCEIAPKYAGDMRFRFILTTLGGLIVNALLLAVGIVFFCLPLDIFGGQYVAISIILRCFLPTSFYVLLINGLPFNYDSGKTDALAFIEAVKREDSYLVAEAILNVQGMVNTGVALKDIDEEMLINVPQLPEDDYNFVILTKLRADYYLVKGDKQKAEKYKARYEQLI